MFKLNEMKNPLSSKLFFITVLLTVVSVLNSQTVLVNEKNSLINESYEFPWAGGINAVQYCEVDFNLDGIMDLLAFDRRGNRPMCFINNGTPNTVDYKFAPEYSDLLPKLSNWVIFADYNMDGKNDIFTYWGPGTMMVFTNVSNDVLKFEQAVYPYLKTLLPGGYVNLFVTDADYPGVADVDNDGDLDILTFGVLGSFVDMHKNMSMEKYGVPDSLDYEHTTYSWGHFAESDESNDIFLDTCFGGGMDKLGHELDKERHVGSTFLVHDIDNNGLVDLLLGDVDYPFLFALYNNGTIDDAYITNIDTIFPSETEEIYLFSMPCPFYIDVDNDDVKDLIVSPFDPGIITSRNKNSSWLYKNMGSDNLPNFQLVEKNFLQGEMIDVGSGAYPVLYDWDKDGLDDLFVGNFGYYWYSYYTNYILHSVYYSQVAYYKNVGTAGNPVFQLWEKNFANLRDLKKQALIPAFADIDNDGNTDLLLGNKNGSIIYVRNNQDNQFEVVDENYEGISVGEFSAPQIFDIDNDGLDDLVIGEKKGNINFYRNEGSVNLPEFVYVTDSLGKVNVTDYSISYEGFSVPCFFRTDNLETGLVVGSEQGEIYYFTNIDGNLSGKFNESDELEVLLDTNGIDTDRGMRTAAIITNMVSNNKLEMIVGNYCGGLEYFNGQVDVNTSIQGITDSEKLNIYPNPAVDKIVVELPKNTIEVEFTIYDIKGSSLLNKKYRISSSCVIIDISSLKDGYYILKSQVAGRVYKNEVIVSNAAMDK